jgi:hypothetical protein
MKIVEKDFKIEIDEEKCVLFTLKSKKEIKEGDTDSYKVAAYSSTVGKLLPRIIEFREGKKYPFKEISKPIKLAAQKHKDTLNNLHSILEVIELPILLLKAKIFDDHRQL